MMEAVDPSVALYQAAVKGGDVAALAGLRELALEAGRAGEVSETESLLAAECYARLAAAIGSPAERKSLCSVLIARARDNRARGLPADWLQTEAADRLRAMSDNGDGEATALLAEVGDVPADATRDETRAVVEDVYFRAAKGEPDVLTSMVALIVRGANHQSVTLDQLVQAEQLARLASFSGASAPTMQLAGVLLWRHAFEAARNPQANCGCAWEATDLLATLATAGDNTAARMLSELVELDPAFASALAEHNPDILLVLIPKGRA